MAVRPSGHAAECALICRVVCTPCRTTSPTCDARLRCDDVSGPPELPCRPPGGRAVAIARPTWSGRDAREHPTLCATARTTDRQGVPSPGCSARGDVDDADPGSSVTGARRDLFSVAASVIAPESSTVASQPPRWWPCNLSAMRRDLVAVWRGAVAADRGDGLSLGCPRPRDSAKTADAAVARRVAPRLHPRRACRRSPTDHAFTLGPALNLLQPLGTPWVEVHTEVERDTKTKPPRPLGAGAAFFADAVARADGCLARRCAPVSVPLGRGTKGEHRLLPIR